MENLDYHTVMEAKIKYYAQKYDPQNKLGKVYEKRKIQVVPLEPTIEQVKKKDRIRRRILAGLDSVISVFL